MKINVCVNGAFRYPQYIRRYAEAGVLGQFHFAHRRSTSAAAIGLRPDQAHNFWAKEYALQAACRLLPDFALPAAERALCDAWQRNAVRSWRDCDSVEAVIGAVADRLLTHVKARGAKVLGHPVCAHPDTVATEVGRAYAELGLDPRGAHPSAPDRRAAELACCDRLLVDSTAVRRSYIRAGYPAERIAVVTPAVDGARFHPRQPDDRDRRLFRVVCVAGITPRKAQHLLLRAWRDLALPGAELVLVGAPGRDAAAVLRHAPDRGWRHLHRVPNARLRALLVTASVFVLPSVEDGFGQAALEAMACGVPVIVTRNVGAADLVTDGRDGFIVPPFDAGTLAEHIERLYRDPDRADAMGEAAAVTAARHADWGAYVGRVLAVHRAMLDGARLLGRAA